MVLCNLRRIPFRDRVRARPHQSLLGDIAVARLVAVGDRDRRFAHPPRKSQNRFQKRRGRGVNEKIFLSFADVSPCVADAVFLYIWGQDAPRE